MTKDLWISIPVKDIDRAVEFYSAVGFTPNPHYPQTAQSASFFIGTKPFVLMLFDDATFSHVSGHAVSDTHAGTEMLISVDAETREEVDAYASKAEQAGGIVFGKPGEVQGWMYGCGFTDPDGHRWNALYMDMTRMPKG